MKVLLRHQKIAVAVVSVFVVFAAASVAVGRAPNFTPFENDNAAGDSIPLQVFQSGDLTLTLLGADFTETGTTIQIEAQNQVGTTHPDVGPAAVLSEGIHVSGVVPIRPVSIEGNLTGDRFKIKYDIKFGPPASREPVSVSIDRVLLMYGDRSELIEGPWDFLIPVPESAPIGVPAVLPREPVSSGGVTVTLQEVSAGPEETLVLYSLSAPDSYMGPAGPRARMFYGGLDGYERGHPVQRGRGVQGDLTLTFPPIPDDVAQLELRFGPYLVGVPGTTVVISLGDPAGRAQAPATLEVDASIDSVAGELVADEIELLQESFVVSIVPTPGAPAAGSGSATVTAYDDVGNFYVPLARQIDFGKTPEGQGFFRRDSIEFSGPLDPAASSLTIEFSEFARVEEGPWNFNVTLDR